MNSAIEVMIRDHQHPLQEIREDVLDWFDEVERRFSRFLPDSELTRVNEAAGQLVMISEEMLEVVLLAKRHEERTSGIFNVLVGPSLQAAGYDRSFEHLAQVKHSRIVPVHPGQSIKIDPHMHSIKVPKGASMDLGGIVKGWAVDRLVNHLKEKYTITNALVNAGGDLFAWGSPSADQRSWMVGVQHPSNPEMNKDFVHIQGKAVATSSTLGRQWKVASGEIHHHLIDPRTGQPSRSDVVQATMIADTVVEAELWAKMACLVGIEQVTKIMPVTVEGYLFTKDDVEHRIQARKGGNE